MKIFVHDYRIHQIQGNRNKVSRPLRTLFPGRKLFLHSLYADNA